MNTLSNLPALRLVGGNDSSTLPLDDERLIREGEAAASAYNKNINTARSRIMPMARGLLAAKRKYPATQDFGAWLQTSSYRDIEKDDRAALIKIGEHDDFAAEFVRTTNLISPRTIWNAIQELLQPTSHDANSDEEGIEPSPKHDAAIRETVLSEFFDDAGGADIYDRIPDARRNEVCRDFLDRLGVEGLLVSMSKNFGSDLREREQKNIDLKLTELRERERKIDLRLKELKELKRRFPD
jgi:hypothetical protein